MPGPWARTLARAVAPLPMSTSTRRSCLRAGGVAISPGAVVLSGVKFTHGRSTIGEAAFVGEDCYFEDHSPIVLERNVWIGAHCKLLTASHEVGEQTQRAGLWWTAGITIESGAWLGASVTILPGITIGNGCIVAAGAVVRASCEPNGLYAGVPAMWKRSLD